MLTGDGDVTAVDKCATVLAIGVGSRRRRGRDNGVVVMPSATLLHYSHNNQHQLLTHHSNYSPSHGRR
jgi:hypothetical protein